MNINWTDDEKQLIEYFSDAYNRRVDCVDVNELTAVFQFRPYGGLNHSLERLLQSRIITQIADGHYRPNPESVQVWTEISTPPPKDQVAELITWARSNPWFAKLIILGIVIPVIWQWVQMISGITNWIINGEVSPP